MNVLLIGSGGREHALAWKLIQSPKITNLTCAPGNAGIANVAMCVAVDASDTIGLLALIQREAYDLVIVGPEAPLAAGLVDALDELGVAAFGPTQMAAQLESSKAFTKDFCKRYEIPTADYGVFTELKPAKDYLKTLSKPYVLKADGLAAGKGVVICNTKKSAEEALAKYFDGAYGEAGQTVIIEAFMEGEEASFFAVCDGENALPLIAAQDHKRAFDGDKGPNTGGMGAYSPTPVFGDDVMNTVMKDIIQPTLFGMAREGYPFTGVLFAGLMITKDGPKLIEYNVRFGDPECQVIMRRLQSDLLEIIMAAIENRLAALETPVWYEDPVVNIVLAANGYPGAYEKGSVISGLDKAAELDGIEIFHAGTTRNNKGILTATGGRVLNVTAQSQTLQNAVDLAYKAVALIDWPEGFHRTDIAHKALVKSET